MEVFGVVIPTWILLFLFTSVLLYIYGRMPFSVWKSLGIPGPPPAAFIGNAHVIRKLGMGAAFDKWTKEYGPVVGVYLMRRPMLVITDVKMLKKILVTDFNNFSHRGFPVPKPFMDDVVKQSLLFVEGPTWKRIRTLATPSFVTGRLREKAPFINKAAEKAAKRLLEAAAKKEKIDAKLHYANFTIDVILATLFSIDPIQNEDFNQEVSRHASTMIRPSNFRLQMFTLAAMFPVLSSLLGKISNESGEANRFYTEFVRQSIERRHEKDCEDKFKDFLQNMIDAENQELKTSHKKLTFEEIVSMTNVFFLAGNDTSSNLLMFMSYLLVKHPEWQDILVEEIDRELGDQDPDYDNIQRLKMLDAVIKETLRLYPATVTYTRKCIQTTEVCGYTIPEGTGIYVAIKAINRSPEYFPQPDKFNPYRFVKGHPDEISPEVPFLGFGIGPRNCIGKVLGLYQVTMAMVIFLRKIKFVGTTEFEIPPAIMFAIPPYRDLIFLELEPRNKKSADS